MCTLMRSQACLAVTDSRLGAKNLAVCYLSCHFQCCLGWAAIDPSSPILPRATTTTEDPLCAPG